MDIVERLRTKKEKYIATVDYGIGVYEELADSDTPDADCIEAADTIERLRNNQSIIIASFRINMMRLCPDYSHEEFDKDIAVMLKEKE